jgi:hypothetical protein
VAVAWLENYTGYESRCNPNNPLRYQFDSCYVALVPENLYTPESFEKEMTTKSGWVYSQKIHTDPKQYAWLTVTGKSEIWIREGITNNLAPCQAQPLVKLFPVCFRMQD